MSDDLREFEEQARQVGRKTLPPAWRTEILDAAMCEATVQANEVSPETLSDAIAMMRRAQRRAAWSMAACFVVILGLIVLLLGSGWKQDTAPRMVGGSSFTLPGRERFAPLDPVRAVEPEVVAEEKYLFKFSADGPETKVRMGSEPPGDRPTHRLAVPPPPPLTSKPPPPADGTGAPSGAAPAVAQIEESEGGFLNRDAALNDVFQMLAERTGKEYFHNSRVDGPEFKVRGHLKEGDPREQMEELASAYGLTLHEKGDTLYALNEEQLGQHSAGKWKYAAPSNRSKDIEQVKELIQPILSPTGVANYEPKTNTFTIVDSPDHVDRARSLLTELDQPNSPDAPGKVAIKGSEFADRSTKEGRPGLERLASRGDLALTQGSAVGGLGNDSTRNEGPAPGRSGGRRVPSEAPGEKLDELADAGVTTEFEGQINFLENASGAVRPFDLRSGVKEEIQADERGREEKRGGRPIGPILTTTINKSEVGNLTTEEVRYSVDSEDFAGDPATTREVGVSVAVTPTVLPDGTIRPQLRPLSATVVEEFKNEIVVKEQPNLHEKSALDELYSTFSLNVSDVSFKLARAALARGEWPAADRIRVEEFVNAFDYGDPAASQDEKVACKLEQAAHPFLQQRNLLRISMKTAAVGRAAHTPLRLTVLLDKSGSMDRADRVECVKNAFRLLAAQLDPGDQVTLIGFARTPRLLADRLSGKRAAELVELVETTASGGGTNLEQALQLGIAKANEQMVEGGQNRIILLTDGAANLGNAQPSDLAKLVEQMRQQNLAFDACGVGADGLNDEILEALTRKGDGRYYVLDRPEDADDGFAKQIAGALRPAARNMKIQVKFNPHRVGRYKLYGFENHLLEKEDFHDDSVDAAELAANEAGTAIYQVEQLPEGSGELGTVSVRFQDAESGRMIEWEWTIPYESQVSRLVDAPASLRLASTAALLAEKLKGSSIGESVEMARLGRLINGLPGEFPADKRVRELVQMANTVRELRSE